MAKKYVNENYFHSCNETRLNPSSCICGVPDMGFSATELIDLLRFYLFSPPTIKNGGTASPYGPKPLGEYGWHGNSLNKLEGRLLNSAGIPMFCFIRSSSINLTLDSMDLKPNQAICITHPRAVLQQDASVKVREDGSVLQSQRETRMECLFRHLRNSYAHNRTYLFPNDNVLMEDCSDDGKVISARILMPRKALIEWRDIVIGGPDGNV